MQSPSPTCFSSLGPAAPSAALRTAQPSLVRIWHLEPPRQAVLKGPFASGWLSSELPVPNCDVSRDVDFRARLHLYVVSGMVLPSWQGCWMSCHLHIPPSSKLCDWQQSGPMGSVQHHSCNKHLRVSQHCSGHRSSKVNKKRFLLSQRIH